MADVQTGTVTVVPQLGTVKLDNLVLPGIYQSMRITREVRMDQRKVAGRSGASKQPLGFEDAEVELQLVCPSDDTSSATTKQATIAAAFQTQDKQGKPFVHRIVHPILATWGISLVVFKRLESNDSNESDAISCSLQFTEHKPVTLRKEARRPKTVLATGPQAAYDAYASGGKETADLLGQGVTMAPAASLDASGDHYWAGQGIGDGFLGGAARSFASTGRYQRDADAAKFNAAVDDDKP